jgi:hypothetical protein
MDEIQFPEKLSEDKYIPKYQKPQIVTFFSSFTDCDNYIVYPFSFYPLSPCKFPVLPVDLNEGFSSPQASYYSSLEDLCLAVPYLLELIGYSLNNFHIIARRTPLVSIMKSWYMSDSFEFEIIKDSKFPVIYIMYANDDLNDISDERRNRAVYYGSDIFCLFNFIN